MLDDIDREAEREGRAILKSHKSALTRKRQSNNFAARQRREEINLLQLLNTIGGNDVSRRETKSSGR